MAKAKKQSSYNRDDQLLFDFNVIEQDIFLMGDVHNIAKMIPQLYDTQHEDVAAAEKRFESGGKGYLYTNGTGTGKTFVGLGNAYRFYNQGKKNILIVVPTDKKCIDWIEDGQLIGLRVYKLEGINDCGHEVSVTTYANFYQNNAINRINWDLIIYDESHYLNQNAKGEETEALRKHKLLSNIPSIAREKAFDYPGVYTKSINPHTQLEVRKLDKELFDKVYNQYLQSTKVIFLSATPFAYHKSIKYGDGTLFEINETIVPKENTSYSYNEGGSYESFMMEHFGYRMSYNKLTIPETGVDQDLMERMFFEKYKEKGIMSTRQLELEYDYSRHFVTIDSELGDYIDKGLELFHQTEFSDKYPEISKRIHRKFNWMFINQLLECIKAKEINRRIQKHLFLGRKVVVFHTYNNSSITHPFRFRAEDFMTEEDRWVKDEIRIEISKFEQEYSEYWNLDLSSLSNTRASIKKHYPYAREFNGTVNKKMRDKYIREFNSDTSDMDLIIVQDKAGREGISLHDKKGNKPRVIINLGLPTAPTTAIQVEGRIYREGLMSNAIYEYATLQTNTERIAFAEKIAQRSKTAENLAMGNLARNLEIAFKEGYSNPYEEDPNLEQGIGGKESDRNTQVISEFQKAISFYFARQKKNSKNKAKEGKDYFATPEPLGMKIVQWLKPENNQVGLEPSAGHGAIARFFPGDTTNHFVEPSFELSSQLAINSKGTIHQHEFERYYVGNKFDFIAMNPPFGVGGKMAMEHIAKACRHLRHYGGSRLIAIIPDGASMHKRLEAFLTDHENRMYVMTGAIELPTVLFERAGTSVKCRIIRIEYESSFLQEFNSIDLSYITDINEFFTEIETLNF